MMLCRCVMSRSRKAMAMQFLVLVMVMVDAVNVPGAFHIRENEAVHHGSGRREDADRGKRMMVMTARIVIVGQPMRPDEALPQRHTEFVGDPRADHDFLRFGEHSSLRQLCILQAKIGRLGPDDSEAPKIVAQRQRDRTPHGWVAPKQGDACLLYTSDAADE